MLECKLTKWKARRCGAGLSLIGIDTVTGKERVITGIKLITHDGGLLLATGPEAKVVLKA